jgi:hypothetical protein
MKLDSFKITLMAMSVMMSIGSAAYAGALQAPPGMFKDLNDDILGDAIIVRSKQLFVDDHIIESISGAEKNLNQPVKHPRNPLIVVDKPWEKNLGFSSVLYDAEEGFFKMWYAAWPAKEGEHQGLGYATSPDGIAWRKPLTTEWNSKEHNNIVFGQTPEFNCAGVFKDPHETDGERRYKMLFSDYPDGTAQTASTSAAYSPDGIEWTRYPQNPLIPFSDSHCCPFWDPRRNRYVAYLRYGPPNTRSISMTESEDFIHWSPKITLFRQLTNKLDEPRSTILYQMEVMPYASYYFGFITTYHGETISEIPKEQEAWKDKSDIQLTFSRDGRIWHRVIKQGVVPAAYYKADRDWMAESQQATFIPWGEHGKDWDWGSMYPHQRPMIVGDQIYIYYSGITGRHWASYHGDTRTSGIGLATLRLDGFVSVDAEGEGTLTTRRLVFIGDTLEVNANAAGGSIHVEALDEKGQVIEGFSRNDCQVINTDSVRHVVKWKGSEDCHLIQARPIKLRFHMAKAKLYSFTPRIRHNHYIQSYD